MTVMQAIQDRRSIRAYKDTPVTDEQLNAVLEAARLAPSWKDFQCWNVIVISGRENIQALGEVLRFNPGKEVFDTVPYFLVFCGDPEKSGSAFGKDYYMADVAICMENAILEAHEQGLGTCWVGWFKEDKVKELLGIPENIKVVALTPLGVPAEAPEARPRMTMDEFVFQNKWGNK